MTTSAWVTLGITYAVILFFTVRLFAKVLRTPPRGDERDG